MVTVLLQILFGIVAFVVGQVFLKGVIEPALELRRSIAGTIHTLLFYQAAIFNATSNKEVATEIKSKSAEILSKSSVMLMYATFRNLFGLPSMSEILASSIELNRISNGMREEVKKFEESPAYNGKKTNFPSENAKAMLKLSLLLKFRTTYG